MTIVHILEDILLQSGVLLSSGFINFFAFKTIVKPKNK